MMIKKLLVAMLLMPLMLFGGDVVDDDKPIRVYVDMIADLFHGGHKNFFRQAIDCTKEEFPGHSIELIVGLSSDEDAAPYKRLPIMTLDERVAAVKTSSLVSEVVPSCPMRGIPLWFIEKHSIDLVVHGDDYSEENTEKYYGDVRHMGIFRMVPYTPGVSTTTIIENVKEHVLHGAPLDEDLIDMVTFTEMFSREMLIKRIAKSVTSDQLSVISASIADRSIDQ